MKLAASPAAVPIPGVTLNKPVVQLEEPLHAELKSFISAVRRRSQPEISLEDGRLALDAAFSILTAIKDHIRHANLAAL
jgi:hypothetical protein